MLLLLAAATKGKGWHRGIVVATDCFMARWQKDDADRSWLRPAATNAKNGDKGKTTARGGGGVLGCSLPWSFDH